MRIKRRRKWTAQGTNSGKILFPERIRVLMMVMGGIFLLITARLFSLQVVQGEKYTQRIQSQSGSTEELIARRGDILVKDNKTGEITQLALNTSLDELRIDSLETPDKKLVADLLAPLVFQKEDYDLCLKNDDLCPEGFRAPSEGPLPAESPAQPADPATNASTPETEGISAFTPSYEQGLELKKAEIFKKINGTNRYVLIKRRISPEVSQKIKDLKRKYSEEHEQDRRRLYSAKDDPKKAIPDYMKGIILVSKPLRFYPEKDLASQIIGFMSNDGKGQYGIEGQENEVLTGEKGEYLGRTDTRGRSIDLSVEDFQKAVDGSDVVLTIDRIIQKKAEDLLKESVPEFHADSGQIIVMDPKTGFILAMANYPTYDLNSFGSVYLTRRTKPEDRKNIFKTTPLFKKDPTSTEKKLIPATFDEYEEGWKSGYDPEFYIYENMIGPGAYLNRTIQNIYEPGSVFKPLVMAVALNEGEVTPSTQYYEDKPVEVEVNGHMKTIVNADGHYKGWQTMTNVLERSANLGMVFVAKTLGKGVIYKNLKNYGFGSETDVELEEELPGTLIPYTEWSTAALLNHAFGQGVAVTPLQVIRAWCALANRGQLPEPHIVSEIRHPDGQIEKIKPKFQSVLKTDTSATITSMLVSAVNVGYSGRAKVPGYRVAGKTGTSQISRTDGAGYEDTTKLGNVITSFAGYAPAEDPRFVVLVKFDRPRFGTVNNIWGETTAAPIFKQMTEFMLDYYGIPPDFPEQK